MSNVLAAKLVARLRKRDFTPPSAPQKRIFLGLPPSPQPQLHTLLRISLGSSHTPSALPK